MVTTSQPSLRLDLVPSCKPRRAPRIRPYLLVYHPEYDKPWWIIFDYMGKIIDMHEFSTRAQARAWLRWYAETYPLVP